MHIDSGTVLIENLGRVVTCAPGGGGPLTGSRMNGLATVEGEVSVGVQNGRVTYLGPSSRAPKEFDLAHRYDARGMVLTPGLIDCHTHPAFVRGRAEEFAMRLAGASYEKIAEAGGGIVNSMNAVREASDEKLLAETARNLMRLKRHGVVAVEGKSGYGLSLEHELRQLRAIRDAGESADVHTIRTCLAAHSLPMEYRGSDEQREEFLRLVTDEILPAAAEGGLAQRADIFCEKGVFSVAETFRVGEAAKRAGLRMTVHAEQLHNTGGASAAAELAADSADHLEFLNDADADAMRDAGTAAVLLPGATYVLKMDAWGDGRRLIDRGLVLALATDFNPGSSPVANPAFVMNLAVMHCGMTPQEALAAFTVNAAYALRLDTAEWGVIRAGSRAAFALWDVDHEAEIPYYAGSNLCSEVITCGSWRS